MLLSRLSLSVSRGPRLLAVLGGFLIFHAPQFREAGDHFAAHFSLHLAQFYQWIFGVPLMIGCEAADLAEDFRGQAFEQIEIITHAREQLFARDLIGGRGLACAHKIDLIEIDKIEGLVLAAEQMMPFEEEGLHPADELK